MRDKWAVNKLIASFDFVARADSKRLSWRYQVLDFQTTLVANDHGKLAAFLFWHDLDDTIDLGQNRRILWLTSFKDLRYSR